MPCAGQQECQVDFETRVVVVLLLSVAVVVVLLLWLVQRRCLLMLPPGLPVVGPPFLRPSL